MDFQAARPIPIDKSQIKRIADKAVRMLPKHLKFRDTSKPLWRTRGFNPNTWGFRIDVYSTTDVQGQAINLPVDFKTKKSQGDWSSPRQYISGGGILKRYRADLKGRPTGYGSKIGFTLYLNTESTVEDILANLSTVKREIYSVLIHEVTHLRDLMPHESVETKPGDDPDDPNVYYNRPSELRAFMQQVSDEAIEYAEKVGKDDPFFLYLNRQFIEQALGESPTWNRVQRYLTSTSEKLLRRGVTRALQDAWPELKRKYPLDEETVLTARRVASRYLSKAL